MAVNVCDYSPSEAAKATEDIDANYPYNNPMGKLGRVGAHFRNALRGTSSSWPVHDLSLDESMRRPIYDFVDNLSWFSREVGDSGYGNIAWIGHVGGPPGDRRDTYHNTAMHSTSSIFNGRVEIHRIQKMALLRFTMTKAIGCNPHTAD